RRHAQAVWGVSQGSWIGVVFLDAAPLAACAAAAVAASPVAASATTWWSRFSRASLVHCQWPAFNGLAVEFRDRVLGVLFGTHGDKCKATRFAGEFVLHQGNFLHRAGL